MMAGGRWKLADWLVWHERVSQGVVVEGASNGCEGIQPFPKLHAIWWQNSAKNAKIGKMENGDFDFARV